MQHTDVLSSGCMGASGKETDGLSQAVVGHSSKGCTLVPQVYNFCDVIIFQVERTKEALSLLHAVVGVVPYMYVVKRTCLASPG